MNLICEVKRYASHLFFGFFHTSVAQPWYLELLTIALYPLKNFFPIKISSIGIKIVHYYNEYCMWMWLHQVLDMISTYIWDIGQRYIHLGLFQTFHNTSCAERPLKIMHASWASSHFVYKSTNTFWIHINHGIPNNAFCLNQTFSFNINMYWLALTHGSNPTTSYAYLFVFLKSRFTVVLMKRCPKATKYPYNLLQPSYPHESTCVVVETIMHCPFKTEGGKSHLGGAYINLSC